jgi:signal transduction histidine kinase
VSAALPQWLSDTPAWGCSRDAATDVIIYVRLAVVAAVASRARRLQAAESLQAAVGQRLAGIAAKAAGARRAAVRERARVARDVHELMGLSAIALKADLIGRDNTPAGAEMKEMCRICAAARADIRLVTGAGQRLSLPGELGAAKRILASVGIQVSGDIPEQPLPGPADEAPAPVLREAITNILRHARSRPA